MKPTLRKLLKLASKHEITPEERKAQVRSFAWGNVHLSNPEITKEDIDKAASKLE